MSQILAIDILLIFSDYLDCDNLYNYSLVCKDICNYNSKKRKKLLKIKSANTISKIFTFKDSSLLSKKWGNHWGEIIQFVSNDWMIVDTIQFLSNALLKNNFIDKYICKKKNFILVDKHSSSYSFKHESKIEKNKYISIVYRCQFYKLYKIEKNLLVKALIY